MLLIIDDAGAKVVVVGSEFFGHVESIEDRLEVFIVSIGDHERWPDFGDWVTGYPPKIRASQRDPTMSRS